MKNVQGDIIAIKTRQPATSMLIKHGKMGSEKFEPVLSEM
jgi:hypothetical protein